MPKQSHASLLVGIDTRDDAGVYQISEDLALVQTVDFFTPIVDDPYWYGAIAAANSLSDIYAMGGTPLTVLNIACFNPALGPATLWAEVLKGAYDKVKESGAVVVGGHSVEDREPKFGLAVTGIVHPDRIFRNDIAQPGQDIYLSKPLGTGIVTTAAKQDKCSAELLQQATIAMATLNVNAMEAAHQAGVRCATDITGFGLAGHLANIARASQIEIELSAAALPVFEGVWELIDEGCTTGGANKTREFLADMLEIFDGVDPRYIDLVCDPQTSGGLAVFSTQPVEGSVWIGRALEGSPKILLRP